MNYTFTPHTGDGSTKVFSFSLAGQDTGYVQRSDINVFVGGVAVPFTLSLQTPNQVTITTAPPVGAEILIRRIVPKTNTYTDFQSGNPFTADNLNKSFLQGLYLQQEWLDGFLPVGFYLKQNVDVGGHKFTNMTEGTVSGDSVNYDQWYDHELRIEGLEGDLTGITSRTIPYYYIATGGETRWAPYGRTFDSAILFINGVFQNQNLGAFSITNNGFNFAEPLVKGDEVYALIGSTPATGGMIDDQDVEVHQPYTSSIIRNQHLKNAELVSILDFGATGDGITRRLSSKFSSLSAAQASYPFATSLSQSLDWAAAQAAAYARVRCHVPKGKYMMTDTIDMPVGAYFQGDGVDYWDTYRPSVGRLLKSWDNGTHFVMVGTGAKSQVIGNINNTLTPKTDSSGRVFEFTKFTNEDSVNGSPATGRRFSCGVKMTHNSYFGGIRVVPNFNGIDGYNDATTLGLGDEWDVGIWVYDGNESMISDVQSVGYWRMAALLITENGGTYDYKGNPESLVLHKVYTQGVRGCLVRNSPEVDVVSINSTSSITVKYNSSFVLTSTMRFTLIGGSQIYTATGYSVSSGNLTFTGVTPALPASASAIRSPVQGNNFSGTVFDSCKFNALDHTSGSDSFSLGLGQAFALEGDGYPCRNLRFIGTKMQTVFDHGNTLLGDARDWKFVASAFENGAMVAYSNSSGSVNFTGNLRMDSTTEVAGSLDISLFDPRDGHIGMLEEPTQFSNGSKVIKHWRVKNLEVQYFNGSYGILLRESDKNFQMQNGNGFMFARSAGATNALDLFGANVTAYGADGLPILQMFGTSKNSNFIGNASSLNAVVTTAVRGSVPNAAQCGTSAFPWSTGYTNTAFTVTSDMRKKRDIGAIPEAVLDAWGDVDWQVYRLIVDVENDASSGYQVGLMAQEILAAFITHGVDATEYGVVTYDKWEEETDPDTGVVTPAGDGYSVNYTHAASIEAAYQRRKISQLEAKLNNLINKGG